MNSTEILSSEEKINLNDINALLSSLDKTMPENLKSLYLKYNGGTINIDNARSYEFASIKSGKFLLEDLVNDLQVDENIVDEEYFPFGVTGVGHFLCIAIDESSENIGKIFIIRHDTLEPKLLSDSLEKFLGVESIDDL